MQVVCPVMRIFLPITLGDYVSLPFSIQSTPEITLRKTVKITNDIILTQISKIDPLGLSNVTDCACCG